MSYLHTDSYLHRELFAQRAPCSAYLGDSPPLRRRAPIAQRPQRSQLANNQWGLHKSANRQTRVRRALRGGAGALGCIMTCYVVETAGNAPALNPDAKCRECNSTKVGNAVQRGKVGNDRGPIVVISQKTLGNTTIGLAQLDRQTPETASSGPRRGDAAIRCASRPRRAPARAPARRPIANPAWNIKWGATGRIPGQTDRIYNGGERYSLFCRI